MNWIMVELDTDFRWFHRVQSRTQPKPTAKIVRAEIEKRLAFQNWSILLFSVHLLDEATENKKKIINRWMNICADRSNKRMIGI